MLSPWPLPPLQPPATGMLQSLSAHKHTHHLSSPLQRAQMSLILEEVSTGLPADVFCTKGGSLGWFFHPGSPASRAGSRLSPLCPPQAAQPPRGLILKLEGADPPGVTATPSIPALLHKRKQGERRQRRSPALCSPTAESQRPSACPGNLSCKPRRWGEKMEVSKPQHESQGDFRLINISD